MAKLQKLVMTTKLYEGKQVVIVDGVEHYLDGEDIKRVPLSEETIKAQCVMNYSKDGKEIFRQIGESKLEIIDAENVIGVHAVKQAKEESAKRWFVQWTLSGGKFFPKYKIRLNAKSIEMIKSL